MRFSEVTINIHVPEARKISKHGIPKSDVYNGLIRVYSPIASLLYIIQQQLNSITVSYSLTDYWFGGEEIIMFLQYFFQCIMIPFIYRPLIHVQTQVGSQKINDMIQDLQKYKDILPEHIIHTCRARHTIILM